MGCGPALIWVSSIAIGLLFLGVSALAWFRPRASVTQALISNFGALPPAVDGGILYKALGSTREARMAMFRFIFPPFALMAIFVGFRIVWQTCR